MDNANEIEKEQLDSSKTESTLNTADNSIIEDLFTSDKDLPQDYPSIKSEESVKVDVPKNVETVKTEPPKQVSLKTGDFAKIGDYGRTKIKNSIQDFLEEESKNLPVESSGAKYDLEEEYSYTKSNGLKNSIPVLLWMVAAFVFVFIMAGTIVHIVNKQNQNIDVEVESFDNLNLSNLLDLISSTQNQINEESANKNLLESRYEKIVKQAEAEKKSALETLDSLNIMDASEKKNRQKEIQDTYDSAMEEARDLKNQIEESQKKIELYQNQLAQYDTTKVQQAKAHQEEMDSEKKLHALEKQQLTKDFEGKISDLQQTLEDSQAEAIKKQEEMVNYVKDLYDPSFSSDNDALTLVEKVANSYSKFYTGGSNAQIDENASEEFKSALKQQTQYYNEISSIGARFVRLPQKNAIPKFAQTMQKIANNAGNELALASINEINKLLGIEYELRELNQNLENEKSQMSSQIESLEGEKQSLIEQNDALNEQKSALENENQNLIGAKESLSAENAELVGENTQLGAEKESLLAEKNSMLEKMDALEAEKVTLESEKSSIMESLENERSSMRESLEAEKLAFEESWYQEKKDLINARDTAESNLKLANENLETLAAEKNALMLANEELNQQSEKYKNDYLNMVTEKELSSETEKGWEEEKKNWDSERNALENEKKSLETEKQNLENQNAELDEANKNLVSQNSQYAQLLQTVCVSKNIQGLVAGTVNSRRVLLYVEKSAFNNLASKASGGALVPVAVMRDGKIIAVGKITVDNGVVYMIKGGEEDLMMVESLLNFEGLNDYTKVLVGDEISISSPM